MQRFNMFYQVHKGLRAMLYETALQLQHTDFWNVDEANTSIESLMEVIRIFEKHAHSEDTFVFPAVQKFEPSVSDTFAQEHVKDHMLGELLAEAIATYQVAPRIDLKAEAGREIQLAFSKFMVFNLEHMAKEEDVLNKILWRYYTDEELLGITQQIVSQISPEQMTQFSRWMLRGLNCSEIVCWLKEAQANAPEFIFRALCETAEAELPAHRYRHVKEGLNMPVTLA